MQREKRIPLNNKGSGPGTERKPLIWEGFKYDPGAVKGISVRFQR